MKKFSEVKKDVLGREDRSDIGKWDGHILELCKKINRKNEYYTTSSCSGRIVLIENSEKKRKGLFLFRTHEKINFKELKSELGRVRTSKLVYFKQEPCILHVACMSLEDAQKLLDSAKLCGWKNSGIMASGNRFVLEMRSTEKLELPVMNKKRLLVDDKFLKILVKEANKKLEKTWEKIQKLEKLIT